MPEKARWISSAVVLGGNGAMGSLFCTQLARDIDHVTAIDSDTASPRRTDNVVSLYADACNLSGEAKAALADADLVIMALPEHVASSALGGITSSLRPKALLVDTLSVKTHIVKAIGDIRPSGESLSINPMFAPSLGFAGQSTAVIILDRGPLASRFLELMESWGCQLVFLTAEEHDRMTAMLQTITHAAILTFGMALHKLDYDLVAVEPLMPPPHRTMLALVARILNADPEVYWDIQSSNPFAAGARAALEDGVRELCQVVDRENRADFRHIVDTLHSLFGEESLQIFQEYCGRMFQLR